MKPFSFLDFQLHYTLPYIHVETQQNTLAADQTPDPASEPHTKKDQILVGPGKEINLQDMDQW